MTLRGEVQKGLELSRAGGDIGSSLEAAVELSTSQESLKKLMEGYKDQLPTLFIVSQVRVGEGNGGNGWLESTELPLQILVSRTDGKKCTRCWNYTLDVGSSSEHPEICNRCITMLSQE